MNYNFTSDKRIELESGQELKGFQIAYSTYGRLNADKSNIIWVCHALTANAEVLDWWKGLFGAGDLFSPEDHFIICANILGSCYGTTGPLSKDANGRVFYHSFPDVSVRDMVSLHKELAAHLDIKQINVLIGGSLGGQQALEWSVSEPDRVKHLILIATNAFHSPWGIAFNETQRMAIESDTSWSRSDPEAGATGLKTARAIALLSYRNYHTFQKTQMEENRNKVSRFKAASYQQYQGLKLVKRFNAFSYWILSQAMDSHQIGRNRESVVAALALIKAKTLVIGVSSDILFPVSEQEFLAHHIPGADFEIMDSLYGHDGFLIETQTLTRIISGFLKINKHFNTNYEQTT